MEALLLLLGAGASVLFVLLISWHFRSPPLCSTSHSFGLLIFHSTNSVSHSRLSIPYFLRIHPAYVTRPFTSTAPSHLQIGVQNLLSSFVFSPSSVNLFPILPTWLLLSLYHTIAHAYIYAMVLHPIPSSVTIYISVPLYFWFHNRQFYLSFDAWWIFLPLLHLRHRHVAAEVLWFIWQAKL